jgi:hypothetical protein
MAEYQIKMTMTHQTTAIVTAESAFEAKCKADALTLDDDGMSAAALTDWAVIGEPKEVGHG